MIKLTSGQVAQLTNISKSTLRHYVDKELVTHLFQMRMGIIFLRRKIFIWFFK